MFGTEWDAFNKLPFDKVVNMSKNFLFEIFRLIYNIYNLSSMISTHVCAERLFESGCLPLSPSYINII